MASYRLQATEPRTRDAASPYFLPSLPPPPDARLQTSSPWLLAPGASVYSNSRTLHPHRRRDPQIQLPADLGTPRRLSSRSVIAPAPALALVPAKLDTEHSVVLADLPSVPPVLVFVQIFSGSGGGGTSLFLGPVYGVEDNDFLICSESGRLGHSTPSGLEPAGTPALPVASEAIVPSHPCPRPWP